MRTLVPALALIIGSFSLLSCKDKKKDPPPEPPAVNHGTIHFKVISYDSLGNMEADNSGIKISLVEANRSAMTDSAGMASFSDLSYGYQTPVLTKPGYDGPLVSVYLDKPAYHAQLPFAKNSHYSPSNMVGKAYGAYSIFFSFNLAPQIPANDSVKVAIIASTAPDMSHRNYTTLDMISVTQNKVTDYNLVTLPKFSAMVKGLDSAAVFYVSAVPASYGAYQSNLQAAPQILGRSLKYPGNVAIIKSWKN